MFQTKLVDKIKRHFMLSNVFENRVVYDIKWKNILELSAGNKVISRQLLRCVISQAVNIV